jgi:hypothetical protein
MKARYLIVTAIISILLISGLVYGLLVQKPSQNIDPLSVYVGIDAAYDNPEEIKTEVDTVCSYTNLFILGSTGITNNETELNDMCQYIYDKGLSFIVYTEMPPVIGADWITYAKATWGNRFLGLYAYDEAGGKQLDLFENDGKQRHPVQAADNYTDARNQFEMTLNESLNWVVWNYTSENVPLFSSDYALYWFDYQGGYNTLFAEFCGSYNRQMNIALCRGAAVALDKDWGVMITRTATDALPESGDDMYADLVTAYDNGAKYLVVFDSNTNYTRSTLTGEHFQALKQFAEYAHKNPRTDEPPSKRTAFVLPKDFAYGFRGPTDKIWGLWPADDFSYNMSVQLGNLLNEYGSKLDVIYDDNINLSSLGYNKLVFWNGTELNG